MNAYFNGLMSVDDRNWLSKQKDKNNKQIIVVSKHDTAMIMCFE